MARAKRQDESFNDPLPEGMNDGGGLVNPEPAGFSSILRSVGGLGGDINAPEIPDFRDARSAEKPRLRAPNSPELGGGDSTGARYGEKPRSRPPSGPVGGPEAAPPRPDSPTPMAGSVQQPDLPASTAGVLPFEPMGDTMGSLSSMAAPTTSRLRGSGLYGDLGGLQGGGLGVPFDPVADEDSDPINLLMKLMGGGA